MHIGMYLCRSEIAVKTLFFNTADIVIMILFCHICTLEQKFLIALLGYIGFTDSVHSFNIIFKIANLIQVYDSIMPCNNIQKFQI